MLPIPNHHHGVKLFRLLTDNDVAIRSQGICLADSVGLSADPLVVLIRGLVVQSFGKVPARLAHLIGPYMASPGAYIGASGNMIDALEQLHFNLERRPWFTVAPGNQLCSHSTEHDAKRSVSWNHRFLGRWNQLAAELSGDE